MAIMNNKLNDVLVKIAKIKVGKASGRRAPHKPLLLLLALGKWTRGNYRLSYSEVDKALAPLLRIYAPPKKGAPATHLPYLHIRTDDLWKIEFDKGITFPTNKGIPPIDYTRRSSGMLSDDIAELIQSDSNYIHIITNTILNSHFPSTLHQDILSKVGLEVSPLITFTRPTVSKKRDGEFRDKILQAYQNRCAVTGFDANLNGIYFCEAAHVQWHAYNGPSDVSNGIALAPTIHKLFDAGAWTLTDDRRILVSSKLEGDSDMVKKLVGLHKCPISSPAHPNQAIKLSYIQWHRSENKGGVFRAPALP